MVEIQYDGLTHLTIRGHAGKAPRGENLICAAVTALALTLGENCQEKKIVPGWAEFTGGSRDFYRGMSRGFDLLARQYPMEMHYTCVRFDKMKSVCYNECTISAQKEKETEHGRK